jgi:signal transduction histidine kinase
MSRSLFGYVSKRLSRAPPGCQVGAQYLLVLCPGIGYVEVVAPTDASLQLTDHLLGAVESLVKEIGSKEAGAMFSSLVRRVGCLDSPPGPDTSVPAAIDAQFRRQRLVATERERKRWSRHLHDETLQGLGALRRDLAGAAGHAAEGDQPVLTSAVAQVDEQIESLRRLIDGLRPPLLDERGLGPALVGLGERARRATAANLDVRLALSGGNPRLPEDIEIAIYRVVQEALNNATKHAQATTIRLVVARRADCIELRISDNGRGFDVDTRASGRGLGGMAEWVALAHGSMEIRSRAGTGTTVEVEVPV